VGTNDWEVGVGSESSKEAEDCVPCTDEGVYVAIAEHIDADTILNDVGLGVGAKILESNLMLALEEESFNVLEFDCAEEEPVLAEEAISAFSIDVDDDIADIIIAAA
jgi:hypothetical protein